MDPRVYFWRTMAGTEVDFVVKTDGGLVPIELKLSGTPRPAMAASVRLFQPDLGDEATPGIRGTPGRYPSAFGSGCDRHALCGPVSVKYRSGALRPQLEWSHPGDQLNRPWAFAVHSDWAGRLGQHRTPHRAGPDHAGHAPNEPRSNRHDAPGGRHLPCVASIFT